MPRFGWKKFLMTTSTQLHHASRNIQSNSGSHRQRNNSRSHKKGIGIIRYWLFSLIDTRSKSSSDLNVDGAIVAFSQSSLKYPETSRKCGGGTHSSLKNHAFPAACWRSECFTFEIQIDGSIRQTLPSTRMYLDGVIRERNCNLPLQHHLLPTLQLPHIHRHWSLNRNISEKLRTINASIWRPFPWRHW